MTHLKYLRKRAGLTLEILSELTGISVSYLSRLESGSRRLNTDLIRRLSGAFGCDPAELLVDKIHEESSLLPAEIRVRRGEMFGRGFNTDQRKPTEVLCDLPVHLLQPGTSEGSVELNRETVVEMRHRPMELFGKRQAFALKAGPHLLPYYTASSLLWLDTLPSVVPEATALLVMSTGRVLLRKVWSVTPTSIQLCALDRFEAIKNGKVEAARKTGTPSHVTKSDGLEEVDRATIGAIYCVVGVLDLSAL
ncbi:MAG: helix-turn-helix transcriptional regulator [Holosporales bacterium]|jgi:transcriptional regulator with XRE-family HTH domain|nr:helix-turn-helix transcriptional regulator [Holosporales bacterium]